MAWDVSDEQKIIHARETVRRRYINALKAAHLFIERELNLVENANFSSTLPSLGLNAIALDLIEKAAALEAVKLLD